MDASSLYPFILLLLFFLICLAMYAAFRQILNKHVWLKPLPKFLVNQQTRILTQKPENIKVGL